MCTQVTFNAIARAVRQTPSVMKKAMAPRRRVRFILAQEYTGRLFGSSLKTTKPPGEGGLCGNGVD
jgi:hypothetical protein